AWDNRSAGGWRKKRRRLAGGTRASAPVRADSLRIENICFRVSRGAGAALRGTKRFLGRQPRLWNEPQGVPAGARERAEPPVGNAGAVCRPSATPPSDSQSLSRAEAGDLEVRPGGGEGVGLRRSDSASAAPPLRALEQDDGRPGEQQAQERD